MEEKNTETIVKSKVKVRYVIPTVILIAAILVVSFVKTEKAWPEIKDIVTGTKKEDKSVNYNDRLKQRLATFKAEFDDSFAKFNDKALDIEAATQKQLGIRLLKNEYYSLVKDSHGYFHRPLIEPFEDGVVEARAQSVIDLGKFTKEEGIDLLYVQCPSSVVEGRTELPTGIYAYDNDIADEMLERIGGSGIETFDLRTTLHTADADIDSFFYKGDHHWNARTAQEAFIDVTEAMNEKFDYNLDPNGIYTDKENYNYKDYKNWFAGSFSRAFNTILMPYDDFTWITPKFDTEFKVEVVDEDMKTIKTTKKGRLEETVMVESANVKGSANCSAAYLRGGSREVRIENLNPDNDRSIYIISTSYGRPFTAFFCNNFKKVYYTDLQYGRYEGNVYEYIKEHKPDTVLILGTVFSLTKEDVWNYNKQ